MRIVPMLQVASMTDTITYYEQVLGFKLDFTWPDQENPKWAQISRSLGDATASRGGEISFLLTIDLGTSSSTFIAEKGNGVVFYVMVSGEASTSELHRLCEDMTDKGAIVVQDLQDFGGRLQFSVADPNGYVLAFSQEFARP